MKNFVTLLIVGISVVLLGFIVYAVITRGGEVYPEVSLANLKVITTSEFRHDQLYISVAEYDDNGNIKLTRVPDYPLSWPLKKDQEVNNQKLWAGSLKKGQSIALVFSLVEQDLSVFDPDDLIGSTKLILKNDHGELHAKWSVPNTSDKPLELTGKQPLTQHYQLSGDGGQYSFSVSVISKKS